MPAPCSSGAHASPTRSRATCSSRRSRARTGTRWPPTTTACAGRRSSSAPAARRAPSSAARHTRSWVPETYNVGLLGHGTVGSAFATLLEQRAESIVPITGLLPRVSGVLTRSRGDYDEILAGSDLIV